MVQIATVRRLACAGAKKGLRVRGFGFCLFAASLFASPQAWAQVYKCIDASGKPVYLQSPCPPGAASKVISRKTPPAQDQPDTKAAEKKAPPDPEVEFRKRQKDRQDAEQKINAQAEETQRRREECARARAALVQYETGVRIARVNEKGERYFLDDAQIMQEKARAQASVTEWCKQ
jgi:hypothetical protein